MAYDNYTDEELIVRLRLGEAEITDYILDKYKPLVRKKANAMFLIGGDTDDLIQEGMIGLFKAIRNYDETRDALFHSFAELCVTRQIYSAVAASQRRKHAPLNSYISFDARNEENGMPLAETLTADGGKNPEQRMIEQENKEMLLEEVKKQLSSMERRVLKEYLGGRNYRQIAEKMGKSPKSIDNALSRIKLKIQRVHGKPQHPGGNG